MHAIIGTLPDGAAPAERAHEGLISLPFMLLRGSTAAGAFAMGFVQTFVFARVLSPDRFSIFIIVGAIGYSLWLCDLGLAKILFVKLRAAHLSGKPDERAAHQATAVILFYLALAIASSLICFIVSIVHQSSSMRDALQLGLFFLYVTLNLAWFCLRSISISFDLYVFYERLELIRRVVNMASMLTMLVGLPLTAFLIGSNVLWVALIATAAGKLIQCGALTSRLRGFPRELVSFFRSNSHAITRSGISALSGVFTASFPYYIVPLAFGLGAAPIILEVTFRIFRGASVIFAAACDLAVPGQTRALAAHDAGRLVRTTLLAAGLCCLPACGACALLIFAGGPLFAFLLHGAATVPPQITPIIVVLLLANVVQIVSELLLQHTGYFRYLARVGGLVVIMMIAASALSIAAGFGILGFLAAYAFVFSTGALCLAVSTVLGPVRAAAAQSGSPHPLNGLFRAIRSA